MTTTMFRLILIGFATTCVTATCSCSSVAQDTALNRLESFLQSEDAKEAKIRDEQQTVGADLDLETELKESREVGLMFAMPLIESLEDIDSNVFPGLAALYEFLSEDGRLPKPENDVSDWAAFNTNKLIRDNPLFWKAYYESAPGDGVLEAIYANLLRA